jgi:arginyl-tRNA--protein-N-Asp/Glu arginylyltransferase
MSKSSFLDSYNNSESYFIIYDDIAFSIVEICSKSLISYQFCWDYGNPDLSLGKFSTYIEIDFALNNNLQNVYLGPSYESNSIYKSHYRGFEFWTGRKWSDDKEAFKYLLDRDSKLNSVDEITEDYKNYFSLLSV